MRHRDTRQIVRVGNVLTQTIVTFRKIAIPMQMFTSETSRRGTYSLIRNRNKRFETWCRDTRTTVHVLNSVAWKLFARSHEIIRWNDWRQSTECWCRECRDTNSCHCTKRYDQCTKCYSMVIWNRVTKGESRMQRVLRTMWAYMVVS